MALVVVLALALAGCGRGREEPGLFGRESGPNTLPPQTTTAATTPAPANPDLPVAGEAVWTSGEGQDIQVRIAVHAVRRIRGGTVLDWSVTPLRGPGLRPGDAVPGSVDLGLTRLGEDNANVVLVDGWARRVYRPLVSEGFAGMASCLCSPLRLAERNLVIGQTQLLQITYPPLPADLPTVDVDVATVPMFWHVPVTDEGLVPSAANPTDLAAPAALQMIGRSSAAFRYGPHGQLFVISVDEVLASSTFTSVGWTIESLTAGAGVDTASSPPFAARASRSLRTLGPVSASGPEIRVPGVRGRPLRALRMSAGEPRFAETECLCTDLRVWASSLQRAEQQVSVVTNLAALPVGTDRVAVVLPGLATLANLPVTVAPDEAFVSGAPVRLRSKTWTDSESDPPAGWSVDQWPTPLPDAVQLGRYRGSVEALIS